MILAIILGGLGLVLLAATLGLMRGKKKPQPQTTTNSTPGQQGAKIPAITLASIKKGQLPLDLILQSVADGVIVTNTDNKIIMINPAAAELLGWEQEEALGLAINSVVKLTQPNGNPLPEDTNPFVQVQHSKQAVKNTLRLTTRQNRKLYISLVVSPIVLPPDYQQIASVAVIRDISRQHQEEMQRAEFISTASHEMRTPVAAIEGYLALAMNDKVTSIDTKARDYLEKAHSSTQHLGKLFQDLLTSAKAEDGRLTNHPIVIEMSTFLNQLVQDLTFSAKKRGLNVEFSINSGGPVDATDVNSKVVQPLFYVYADQDRLREVVTNLADNAIKYTEQGTITLGLTGDETVVQFFVKDTGAGIPQEDTPHLFQKFYRVNNTLTRTQGGTGLGLFICRKIVELYNGRIWVESTPGKGSTFYVNLPRLSLQKAKELQATETVWPDADKAKALKVQ